MTDNLRDRIADEDEKHYQMLATDGGWLCACGHHFSGNTYREWRLHKADAVIAELGSDCIYRYACANCGDFWFDKSERMQRFALLHSRSHLAVIQETKQCEKAGGGFSQWHRYVTEWTADS